MCRANLVIFGLFVLLVFLLFLGLCFFLFLLILLFVFTLSLVPFDLLLLFVLFLDCFNLAIQFFLLLLICDSLCLLGLWLAEPSVGQMSSTDVEKVLNCMSDVILASWIPTHLVVRRDEDACGWLIAYPAGLGSIVRDAAEMPHVLHGLGGLVRFALHVGYVPRLYKVPVEVTGTCKDGCRLPRCRLSLGIFQYSSNTLF